MAVDSSLQATFLQKQASLAEARNKAARVTGSGGGEPPPPDDGDGRIRELEKSMRSVEASLAVILEKLNHTAQQVDSERLRTEMAALGGKVDQKAGAAELAELRGRVMRLPTVPVLVGLFTLVAMIAGAARWLYAAYHP